MVRSHFARHISARTNGRNKPANECINIWRRNIAKEKLSAHQNCDRKVRLIGILTDSVKKDNRRGNEFGKAETEAISGEQPKWFSISEANVPPFIASTNEIILRNGGFLVWVKAFSGFFENFHETSQRCAIDSSNCFLTVQIPCVIVIHLVIFGCDAFDYKGLFANERLQKARTFFLICQALLLRKL